LWAGGGPPTRSGVQKEPEPGQRPRGAIRSGSGPSAAAQGPRARGLEQAPGGARLEGRTHRRRCVVRATVPSRRPGACSRHGVRPLGVQAGGCWLAESFGASDECTWCGACGRGHQSIWGARRPPGRQFLSRGRRRLPWLGQRAEWGLGYGAWLGADCAGVLRPRCRRTRGAPPGGRLNEVAARAHACGACWEEGGWPRPWHPRMGWLRGQGCAPNVSQWQPAPCDHSRATGAVRVRCG
jgi:hypothetical protein